MNYLVTYTLVKTSTFNKHLTKTKVNWLNILRHSVYIICAYIISSRWCIIQNMTSKKVEIGLKWKLYQSKRVFLWKLIPASANRFMSMSTMKQIKDLKKNKKVPVFLYLQAKTKLDSMRQIQWVQFPVQSYYLGTQCFITAQHLMEFFTCEFTLCLEWNSTFTS